MTGIIYNELHQHQMQLLCIYLTLYLDTILCKENKH